MSSVGAVVLLDEADCQALEATLVDRIHEFNVEATGHDDARLIGGSVRGDDGALQAGFSGHTWGKACVVTHLWVATACRGRGLGQLLLASAEAEAARRGCVRMLLSTHSFQAPGFYERLGYEAVSAVDDWPQGHANIVYRKRLPGADREAA